MTDNMAAPPKKQKTVLREYVEAIVIAGMLALFIRAYIVQAFKIPSGSMETTLLIGDHILVNKFLFGTKLPFKEHKVWIIRHPQRGDIVVFKFPEDEKAKRDVRDFIKRVIGTPGDIVEVKDKKVFVNGYMLKEPYTRYEDKTILPRQDQPRDNYGPVKVPPSQLFVMGDNRDRSYDSRFWGFVEEDKVEGKALVMYWSWDGDDKWVRWGRIGHLVE